VSRYHERSSCISSSRSSVVAAASVPTLDMLPMSPISSSSKSSSADNDNVLPTMLGDAFVLFYHAQSPTCYGIMKSVLGFFLEWGYIHADKCTSTYPTYLYAYNPHRYPDSRQCECSLTFSRCISPHYHIVHNRNRTWTCQVSQMLTCVIQCKYYSANGTD